MKIWKLVLLFMIFVTSVVYAEAPQVISYQGHLTKPNGAQIPNGTYTVQFAVYDQAINGTPLWQETIASVNLKDGLFACLLGSSNVFPADLFSQSPRYLGIKVGNDSELAPRQRIASVPYAIETTNADVAKSVINGAVVTDSVADGAITAQKLAANALLPTGVIVMWSGKTTEIPVGWLLCDGSKSTPDLRDRFIVGAGGGYAVGDTGGVAAVVLTWAQMPVHNHGINDPGHIHQILAQNWEGSGGQRGSPNGSGSFIEPSPIVASTTGITIQNAGGNQAHENRPPYYALCYIMKQ